MLLEWEEEKVISRGGEKKKGRKEGKVKKKGREGGTEGRKKKKNRKEKKKRKGRINNSTPNQRSPLPWHLKLPTPRGLLLDLAGQACWWDPTLGPGHPLPPGQGWLHNPSVEAVQEASHMG